MAFSTPSSVEVFYNFQTKIFKLFALLDLPKNPSRRLKIAISIYFWHVVIFWILLFDLSMMIKFIGNITSLTEIIKVFFIFATNIAVLGKFITVRLKRHSYAQLFRLMHEPEFLPVNRNEIEVFDRAVQLSKQVRNNYTVLSLMSLNAMLLTQYIINNTELPISAHNFFDVDTKLRYGIVYTYQYIALSMGCFLNIAFDSIATSFFIYLMGQMDILAHRLENIGRNSDDSQQFINLQLKNCIRYYSKIVDMSERMEDLVSIPISVQIICSVLVLVANFYAISSLSADFASLLKFLLYQMCMLTQIFILCYFSNEVSLKSAQLSYSLYMSDWAVWNKDNRKLVLLMMLRLDVPLRIKTINRCYSFNLAAFTSIVNSAYSYFALLKKVNN